MRINARTTPPSGRGVSLRDARVLPACTPASYGLEGLITDADLPAAEAEWPGLRAFFVSLAADDRPRTFLDLVWRFETRGDRATRAA